MKNSFARPQQLFGKHLYHICLAFLAYMVCNAGPALSADNLDDCLLKALQGAENSVTVGQLREQCKQSGPDISAGPAELVLKTSRARKPAFFPHMRHQGIYPCATCHHGKDSSGRLEKYTEDMVIYKCTTCHNPSMPNVELNGFMAIGHELCRECHRTHQDLTSATCGTCHRKNL